MAGIFDNAQLDAATLEVVVNGDDQTDVTARLGEVYPTVSKTMRLILEQSTIDATVFNTKSLMTASGLPNDTYTLVVSDPVAANNGYYQKRAGDWVYLKYNLSGDVSNLKYQMTSKPSINIFENTALTSATAELYQASLAQEGGFDVLLINDGVATAVFYQQLVDDSYVKVGNTLTFSIDVFCGLDGASGCDITLQAIQGSKTILATSVASSPTVANEWQTISTVLTLPTGTSKIRVRMIRRSTGITVKFRKPLLASDSFLGSNIIPKADEPILNSDKNTLYVSKSGNNANAGTQYEPLLTIQKAVDGLPDGGSIIVLDDSDYRETITVDNSTHVKISAVAGKRVNLFGSDKLVVTKTTGMTKVYQAPLAAKPVGMGGARGKPVIFEWGTPSKTIIEAERHQLHRGLTHRLPYTEMFEATSKAELDSVNGKWFWEAGIIYFSATDGSNATLKRYEARLRPVLTHSKGSIELVRVTTWFSRDNGMTFNGLHTKRVACIAYGAHANGFADNANFTESYKDISGGNGNDGFNATVTDFTTNPEINDRLEQTYFDPYGHDNGDDGISDHYRADCTIYGGYFEYNTKADVVHVTGSNSVCYNTQTRGTLNGFYAATSPTGDVSRVKTVMRCVGTKSHANGYGYRAADDAEIICDNTTAIDPTGQGYYQTGTGAVYANDCKFIGNPAKTKSGNVVINNSDLLTP